MLQFVKLIKDIKNINTIKGKDFDMNKLFFCRIFVGFLPFYLQNPTKILQKKVYSYRNPCPLLYNIKTNFISVSKLIIDFSILKTQEVKMLKILECYSFSTKSFGPKLEIAQKNLLLITIKRKLGTQNCGFCARL